MPLSLVAPSGSIYILSRPQPTELLIGLQLAGYCICVRSCAIKKFNFEGRSAVIVIYSELASFAKLLVKPCFTG